jgi:hypothetical protein
VTDEETGEPRGSGAGDGRGAAAQPDGPLLDPRAIARGASIGLAIIVPVTVVGAILERTLDDPCGADSHWIALLVIGLFAAYVIAGFAAGSAAPGGALSNGSLAGLGAFVLWIPVRLFIYAIRGDVAHCSHHIFTAGQIFGQLLFATAFGMLGGFFGGRRASARE